MRVGKGKKHPKRTVEQRNLELRIREKREFEKDWFSLPAGQEFPHKEYLIKTWCTNGVISAGKTTFSKKYVGNMIIQEWGRENVGLYIAQDLYAIIDAIKNSKKHVHYVLIDDSIPVFDSRRSMSSNNVNLTEFYFEIRHQLRKHAERGYGNVGGLVFINIIVQDVMSLDRRLRDALGFTIFKSWDDALKSRNIETEIVRTLKKIKYKVSVACDNKFRRLAIAIDCEDKYTLFNDDMNQFPDLYFEYVDGGDIVEMQMNNLINYLVENFNVLEEKSWYLEGKLFNALKQIKASGEFSRINKSNFSEIIKIAKTIAEDQRKTQENDENESIENVIADDRTEQSILILHDTFNKSFKEISKLLQIGKTTAWEKYQKHKAAIENTIIALRNSE